jgi:hypothetical protein
MDVGPMILDTIERSGGVVVWESCFMEFFWPNIGLSSVACQLCCQLSKPKIKVNSQKSQRTSVKST